MTWNKLNCYTFVSSLCLHVLLLLCFCTYFQYSVSKPLAMLEERAHLTAYLYPPSSPGPMINSTHANKLTEAMQKVPLISRKNSNKPVRNDLKETIVQNKTKKASSTNAQKVASITSENIKNDLLAYLHHAIQAKQTYPDAALLLEREGRVTLAFILHKNGTIANLRIVQKSGTEGLDQAALQAVEAATPFKEADKFIKVSGEYRIDVVFELTV